MAELTPREIVRELDRYIVGQDEAKRSVAIALRNPLPPLQGGGAHAGRNQSQEHFDDWPHGCGQNGDCPPAGRLVNAPFIKVEATKFTEVGYVGRDVESIVRDLVENAIRMVKEEHEKRVQPRARVLAEDRLVTLLVHPPKKSASNPLDFLLGKQKEQEPSQEEQEKLSGKREEVRQQLMRGELEERELEIEVTEEAPKLEVGGSSISLGDMMGGMMPKKTKIRHVKVKEARKILEQEEADKAGGFRRRSGGSHSPRGTEWHCVH